MLANPAVKVCSFEIQGRSLVVGDLLRRRHLIQSAAADARIDTRLLEGQYLLLIEKDRATPYCSSA